MVRNESQPPPVSVTRGGTFHHDQRKELRVTVTWWCGLNYPPQVHVFKHLVSRWWQFREVTELLRNPVLLEEVCQWGWQLRVYNLALLPVPSLCFLRVAEM